MTTKIETNQLGPFIEEETTIVDLPKLGKRVTYESAEICGGLIREIFLKKEIDDELNRSL